MKPSGDDDSSTLLPVWIDKGGLMGYALLKDKISFSRPPLAPL